MGRQEKSLYLCAPVNALVEGIYEENIHLKEVLGHGDFGLGTFDDLDGEMLILDGRCLRMRADGTVAVVDGTVSTPFAAVTFFSPDSRHVLDSPMEHDAFMRWLETLMASRNLLYAFRISGEFRHIKARSVPRQANYRPLAEVAGDQEIFEFTDISGTLAGFFTPDFLSSLNVPGMHLHFLSEDSRHGGHVLECAPVRADAAIQLLHRLELSLPMTPDYLSLDFHRDTGKDLDAVEK